MNPPFAASNPARQASAAAASFPLDLSGSEMAAATALVAAATCVTASAARARQPAGSAVQADTACWATLRKLALPHSSVGGR